MNIQKLNIDLVKPYWRNPRKIEKAVEAVKQSIQKYGYNSPIIVDQKNVIIAGHVRYKALRELGYQEINCVVLDISEEKAKQYRIADNKSAEKAEWDKDSLLYELREIEELEDMQIFFDGKELDSLISERNEILEEVFEEEEEIEEIEEQVREEVYQEHRFHEKEEEYGAEEDTEEREQRQAEIEREVQERVEQEVQQRMEEQRRAEAERLAKENERIKQREQEMREQFEKRSEEKEEDYVEIECPHCDEKYILSRSELLRSAKVRRTL